MNFQANNSKFVNAVSIRPLCWVQCWQNWQCQFQPQFQWHSHLWFEALIFFFKNWINFDKKGKKARRCTSLLRSADERTCTWNPFNRTSQQLSQKSQNKHELETQGAIWYLLVNHYTAPLYEFWIKIVADPRIKTFDPRKQIISHYFGLLVSGANLTIFFLLTSLHQAESPLVSV